MEDWNLSDKIYVDIDDNIYNVMADKYEGSIRTEDVREFIKTLKFECFKHIYPLEDYKKVIAVIDKLAGEKLI